MKPMAVERGGVFSDQVGAIKDENTNCDKTFYSFYSVVFLFWKTNQNEIETKPKNREKLDF